jgi:hypothetical protein
MMHWCPAFSGLLTTRPPLPQHVLLMVALGSTPAMNKFSYSTPPGLALALNSMAPPTQYQGGGGWYMDTDTGAHMTNDLGNLSSIRPAPSSSHIIVGNNALLSVWQLGSTTIPSSHKSMSLFNIMISPGLIKNLISIHAFTCDNWVFIEFDPFGFSIKDLLTRTVLL